MAETRPRQTKIVPADPASIAIAAACLREGGLVAMPTETVYGLAALATLDAAVASIYAAKGRPSFNPLIAHFADLLLARAGILTHLFQLADFLRFSIPLGHQLLGFVKCSAALGIQSPELILIEHELFLEAAFSIVEGGHVVPMAARNRGHISRPARSRNRKPGCAPKFAQRPLIR